MQGITFLWLQHLTMLQDIYSSRQQVNTFQTVSRPSLCAILILFAIDFLSLQIALLYMLYISLELTLQAETCCTLFSRYDIIVEGFRMVYSNNTLGLNRFAALFSVPILK